MTRSTTTTLYFLLATFLLTTLLPILNSHNTYISAVPIPISVFSLVPIPIPAAATPALDTSSTKNSHHNPKLESTNEPSLSIKKRQLLGGLLGGLPSFRNEGGNAIAGGRGRGGSEQPETDGVVPGGNTVNIGAR